MKRFDAHPFRGALAGFIGAAVLALWFLALDAGRGRPFATVSFLSSLFGGRGGVFYDPTALTLYTVAHFAVFMILGTAAAKLFDTLRLAPSALYGTIIGFILFDIGVYLGLSRGGGGWMEGSQWGEVLGGCILAGISLTGSLRLLSRERRPSWSDAVLGHHVLREGAVVGAIGATVVALWFLVVDAAAGEPLRTPALLGGALFGGPGVAGGVAGSGAAIAGYTLLHYLVFILGGCVAAAIFSQAERRPNLLVLGGLGFVTLLAFFFGALALFAEWLIGGLAWWNVALGSLLAVLAMGGRLARSYPEVGLALMERSLLSES